MITELVLLQKKCFSLDLNGFHSEISSESAGREFHMLIVPFLQCCYCEDDSESVIN